MSTSVTIYTGTCTMVVADNVATITKVTDDTSGGFALLTTGARFECTVGSGTVDTNTGTVITISCWSGDSTTDTISWKGIPPLSNAASASAALEVLRGLNTLNSLPTGRVMTTAGSTTLKRMDAYVGGWRFISMALTAPPDSPSDGDTYLVADSATDAWADKDGKIAHRQDGDWLYLTPVTGMLAYNAADGLYYRYTGSAWTADIAVTSYANSWSKLQYFKSGISVSGGDFEIDDDGTNDTDAIRLFSNSGTLYLQAGDGDHITFRNKTGSLVATLDTANKYLGVGTSSPAKTLDVSGTLRATGAATFGSTLNATGAVTFGSTLKVSGAATFDDTVTAPFAISKSGSFTLAADGTSTTGVISGLSAHSSYLLSCYVTGTETSITLTGIVQTLDGNAISNVTTLMSTSYNEGSLALETYDGMTAGKYSLSNGNQFQITGTSENGSALTVYWTLLKFGGVL